MPRSLVVKCLDCGQAIETLDPRRNRARDLGEAVQRAAADGRILELADGKVEVGCRCATPADRPPEATRNRYRVSLKQILLVITAIAILLTVFRHPISMLVDKQTLADQQVQKAVAAPWSVYGWLFFGEPVINPKPIKKSPVVIVLFLANVALAGFLPFAVGWTALAGFKRLWRMASNE